MDQQILAFIAALRASGVRVSLAESIDALRAVEQAGVGERGLFRAALQATLVKERADLPTFQRLFPLYFGAGEAAPLQRSDDGLSAEEQGRLSQALGDLLARSEQTGLAQLFQAVVEGRPLGQEQLLALLPRPAPSGLSHPTLQRWAARQSLRDLQLDRLEELTLALLAQLRADGLGEAALDAIAQRVRANQAAQAEQISQAVIREIQRLAGGERPRQRPLEELLDRPFHLLSAEEAEELRGTVARLAAQLRTRAGLRRRRARRGALDPRGTIRASLRFGGVPVALRMRRRRLRPRLIVLCDVSSSMRTAASFMLMLVAALHDQVGHTRAFAYIDELYDITTDFIDARPAQAIAAILGRIRAEYAPTDLGSCLERFVQRQLGGVDRRTTVIILGDGRNNGSDPGLGHLRRIKERARHLIWFTPERRQAWGSGDSAMPAYAPLCDAVHVVGSLRQLAAAVERVVEG